MANFKGKTLKINGKDVVRETTFAVVVTFIIPRAGYYVIPSIQKIAFKCPFVRTYLLDRHSEVSNGLWPLQIVGVNLVRLTPQAHFNPITPYCTNPNLTSLNTAVQIANLIMYRGHVRLSAHRFRSLLGAFFNQFSSNSL